MSRHRRVDDGRRVVGRFRPARHTPCSRAQKREQPKHIGRRITITVVTLALLGLTGAAFTFWRQGYRVYVVHTGSMSPTYRPGDVVVDGPPAKVVRPGQVITFRHSDRTTDVVTHRVVGVTPAGIKTKGDANRTADVWTIRPDQVKGRVLFGLRDAGYLLVYLHQPSGIGSLAAIAFAIALLWGMFFPSDPERPSPPDTPERAGPPDPSAPDDPAATADRADGANNTNARARHVKAPVPA